MKDTSLETKQHIPPEFLDPGGDVWREVSIAGWHQALGRTVYRTVVGELTVTYDDETRTWTVRGEVTY